MKKILITGGTGYLGARLSKYHAEKGHKITVQGRFDPSAYSEWMSLMDEVIIGDIRDEGIMARLCEGRFDAIIHLVSLDHFKSEDAPELVSSYNLMPTWKLLDIFAGKGLEKFIYFSTQQVLGKLPTERIDETRKPQPINKYGLTHQICEEMVGYYDRVTDICGINIRLSNGYGSPVFKENKCWWYVIHDLCKSAWEKREIRLLSDGSPQRDFLHVTDICRAVELLLEQEIDSLDKTYQVASGKTRTILELAHAVQTVFKMRYSEDVPVILSDGTISPDSNRYSQAARYTIEIDKIRRLGIQPKVELHAGIGELFDYLKDE